MRILYGACADGMGHATRSAVIGSHLRRLGHEVMFASEGRPADHLRSHGFGVIPIVGLQAIMVGGAVSPGLTALSNLVAQLFAPGRHLSALREADAFGPDVVVSDFDPVTARYAQLRGLPCVAVDNIHFATRCWHPPEIVQPDGWSAVMMTAVTNGMVPDARRYLVLTFADARVTAPATTLHHPLIRPEVQALAGAPRRGHVVAYLNDKADHRGAAEAMQRAGIPVRLYGAPVERAESHGLVELVPFSAEGFLSDLATAAAVVAGAGFTMTSEAIYLGKPLLALPFGNQFEQQLNASYLQALGYGERCDHLDAERFHGFLSRMEAYRDNLCGYVHDDNAGLLAAVAEAIQC